jgi:hypothetical protein
VRRDCRAETPRAAAGGWLKRQHGLGRHGGSVISSRGRA